MWRMGIVFSCIVLLGSPPLIAQSGGYTFKQLADINRGAEGSHPGGLTGNDFVVFKNTILFNANDGVHGSELYRYDGQHISLVADINPGKDDRDIPLSSDPGGFIVFRDTLFFRADDGVHGRELFAYDGTSVGLVADIHPGLDKAGKPNGSYPSGFSVFNDKLIFKADNGTQYGELFMYDGRDARMLADIFPGRKGSRARDFTLFRDAILFSADDTFHNRELFAYDGRDVRYITQPTPGENPYRMANLKITHFTIFNDALIFRAEDEGHGTELFKYDGQQVSLAADINPFNNAFGIPNDSNPTAFAVLNGTLFFSADDGVSGRELFAYDGTGIRLVADIAKGDKNGQHTSSNPSALTVYGNRIIFSADDGLHGDELYVYDGNRVSMVADLYPGFNRFGDPNSSDPRGFITLDDKLFFSADDSIDGERVFVYDGMNVRAVPYNSPGGRRIKPGKIISTFRFSVYNQHLIFGADDGTSGQELWIITSD